MRISAEAMAGRILTHDNYELFKLVRDQLNEYPGTPIAAVARGLGVSVDALCRWIIEFKEPRSPAILPMVNSMRLPRDPELRAELIRLRRREASLVTVATEAPAQLERVRRIPEHREGALTKGPQWMPLNVSDYLRDTTHLSAAEHGAYCLMIMHYWKDGGLPETEDFIRRLTHLSAEQWIESRPVLAALFDEGWKHKRIDAELAKAADLISKRSARAVQQHSRRMADAEPEHSAGSDTRVPPSPLPEQDITARPVLAPEGARDLFSELVEAFPANPTASETKARKAWDRLKPVERVEAVAAAERFARWFAQDCEARGRTIDAGLSFVPHLSTWLDSGQWREASRLPVKGEVDPSLAVVRPGTPDFEALKRHRKVEEIIVFGESLTVTLAELEQARAGVMH